MLQPREEKKTHKNITQHFAGNCFETDYTHFFLLTNKQEAHGPHRSHEKPVQINKHI